MEKLVATTPVGESQWYSLSKPDKFGNFTCNLILEDCPATHKLLSQVKELANGLPINFVKKLDDGRVQLKMKLKSQGTKRDGSVYSVNPPAIYDHNGERISGTKLEGMSVGNGSEIRAKLQFYTWEFAGKSGVSCKPLSVQIKKLVHFDGGSEDLGFDAFELENVNVETKEQEESVESEGNYDF